MGTPSAVVAGVNWPTAPAAGPLMAAPSQPLRPAMPPAAYAAYSQPLRPAMPPAGNVVLRAGLVWGILPAIFGILIGLTVPSHVNTFQCSDVCTDPAQPVISALALAAAVINPLLYVAAGWRAARLAGKAGIGAQAGMMASLVGSLLGGASIVIGVYALELRLYPQGAASDAFGSGIVMAVSLLASLLVGSFFGWLGGLGGASGYRKAAGYRGMPAQSAQG